jgi:hypothetical protein
MLLTVNGRYNQVRMVDLMICLSIYLCLDVCFPLTFWLNALSAIAPNVFIY